MRTKLIAYGMIAGLAVSGIGLLTPTSADAVTCSSVCNQIRRACQHSAKGGWKAQKVICDQAEETCQSDCAANAATCDPDCDAAQGDCVATCAGDTLCEADCATTATQCHDNCINCDANCEDARDTCRSDAKADRDASREFCGVARTTCNDQCVNPIDGQCVKGCTRQEHDCRSDAKRAEKGCKRACRTGEERKSCYRECRRNTNLAAQLCEDDTVLCYAGCAGVDLTPPTTTTTLPSE